MTISFTTVELPELPTNLVELLPEQGSFEMQHDQPGKTHPWHRHSVTEELFILQGSALLFWMDGDDYHERDCPAGTWITLVADAAHGSTAGEAGVVYMIRPEGGQAAHTVFLDAEENPSTSSNQ